MPLPVHHPSKHKDPKIMKARLKMEMAAAEMLYSVEKESIYMKSLEVVLKHQFRHKV